MFERLRVLYTRDDGGVSVYQPAPQARFIACNGGGLIPPSMVERQVELFCKTPGVTERAARAWVNAMAFGGHVTASFLDIAIAKDVCSDQAGAHAIEIIDLDDLPRSRVFRDAWHRSRNGGPIIVDVELARSIHLKRLVEQCKAEREALRDWRQFGRHIGEPCPTQTEFKRLAAAISRAESPEELLSIWSGVH